MNTIWLGALLTLRLASEHDAKHAADIVAVLEALRARTLEGVVATRMDAASTAGPDQQVTSHLDLAALRHALAQELKLRIDYVDGKGRCTSRIVWPLDVQDFGPNGAMFTWCERRGDFRNFRFDRIESLKIEEVRFDAPRSVMAALYAAIIAIHSE